MRAAAILGPGCSPKKLKPFQSDASVSWCIGLPGAADEADVILLFGGDGTVHRHLGALLKLCLPVLIVPTGSGNDFARALGVRSVNDSLVAWRRFCARRHNVRFIDLGVIAPLAPKLNEGISTTLSAKLGDNQYFASVAGVGLDSEVARRAQSLPRWLRSYGGYALTLVPTIFRFGQMPIKIYAPDEAGEWTIRSNQPTILAAFANTSTYGGGMKIAPQAQPDDGKLDICVIGSVDPFKLACMFPTVYFGRHLRIKNVGYFQAGRLRLETEFPLDVYADGEYVCRTPVEVGVECGALRVLTP
jgi:diacylglycerol kinase (ATP)